MRNARLRKIHQYLKIAAHLLLKQYFLMSLVLISKYEGNRSWQMLKIIPKLMSQAAIFFTKYNKQAGHYTEF